MQLLLDSFHIAVGTFFVICPKIASLCIFPRYLGTPWAVGHLNLSLPDFVVCILGVLSLVRVYSDLIVLRPGHKGIFFCSKNVLMKNILLILTFTDKRENNMHASMKPLISH
jgi:hypothetical protein